MKTMNSQAKKTTLKKIKKIDSPKLLHHRFKFGLIGNVKVLMCRILGHRLNDNIEDEWCNRCKLAYEEIYPNYWNNYYKKHNDK